MNGKSLVEPALASKNDHAKPKAALNQRCSPSRKPLSPSVHRRTPTKKRPVPLSSNCDKFNGNQELDSDDEIEVRARPFSLEGVAPLSSDNDSELGNSSKADSVDELLPNFSNSAHQLKSNGTILSSQPTSFDQAPPLGYVNLLQLPNMLQTLPQNILEQLLLMHSQGQSVVIDPQGQLCVHDVSQGRLLPAAGLMGNLASSQPNPAAAIHQKHLQSQGVETGAGDNGLQRASLGNSLGFSVGPSGDHADSPQTEAVPTIPAVVPNKRKSIGSRIQPRLQKNRSSPHTELNKNTQDSEDVKEEENIVQNGNVADNDMKNDVTSDEEDHTCGGESFEENKTLCENAEVSSNHSARPLLYGMFSKI